MQNRGRGPWDRSQCCWTLHTSGSAARRAARGHLSALPARAPCPLAVALPAVPLALARSLALSCFRRMLVGLHFAPQQDNELRSADVFPEEGSVVFSAAGLPGASLSCREAPLLLCQLCFGLAPLPHPPVLGRGFLALRTSEAPLAPPSRHRSEEESGGLAQRRSSKGCAALARELDVLQPG